METPITSEAPGPEWISISPNPGNLFQKLVLDAWGRLEGDDPVFGFRVQQHHCNSRQICHGGMLMTFCDYILPAIARLKSAQDVGFTPTVSMTTNFIAPAKLGTWLEGRANVLRRSTHLVFVEGVVKHADTIIVQVSGIFKQSGGEGLLPRSPSMIDLLPKGKSVDQR